MLGLFKKTGEKAQQAQTAAQVYLARQPIFDIHGDVFAYELLYRSGNVSSANVFDADKATSTVIANTFLNIGIDEISNGKPVFINLPRKFITGEIPLELDPKLVVLEVLEDISADKQAMQGIEELYKRGYTVALDDFVLGPNNHAFIMYAHYIKVDVLGLSDEELRRQTALLIDTGLPLLAEKVEDEHCHKLCLELGYQYFQGYFFSKPTLIEGKELGSNQLALLNILSKLQNPDCQVEDLEKIIGSDVGLSFKLLKIINSSYYNVGKTVESIQQALVLMGFNSLRKWVTLITLSATETKSSELMVLALLRAKHCENLAEKLKVKGDAAFTVGMFSLLDAIMDQPLSLIVKQLPLSDDVKDALLKGTGDLGTLLLAVVHFEHGNFEFIEKRFTNNGLISDTYRTALTWCDAVRADLGV